LVEIIVEKYCDDFKGGYCELLGRRSQCESCQGNFKQWRLRFSEAEKRVALMKSGMDNIEAETLVPQNEHKELIEFTYRKISLTDKAKNLAKAVGRSAKKIAKGEKVKVVQKVADYRWSKCSSCENLVNNKCKLCGCGMTNKIWWSSEKCPIDKWGIDYVDKGGKVAVIIPSRNEPYLVKTVIDLIENALGEIEIWVVLDAWDNDINKQIPEIKALKKQDSRINIIENEVPKGLRWGMNKPASITDAKYVFKVDAHMSFSFGYDLALKNHCDEKTVCIPRLRSLHPETWTPGNRFLDYTRFTRDFKMAYWMDFDKRTADNDTPEILCAVGCSWFCETQWWKDIGGQDESLGLWGQSWIEVGLKTWFNGGRQILVKSAINNHYFRKKFPYKLNGNHVKKTKEDTKNLWKDHPKLDWLLDKFNPVPGWHDVKENITPHRKELTP